MNVVKTHTWRYSLSELPQVTREVNAAFGEVLIWLFRGTLGAGKTTFIQQLGLLHGITTPIQSPTFSLVNEYLDEHQEPIYHFDCYRFSRLEEAFDMGMEEYLSSGFPVWVEWPERIEELWPENYLLLTFQFIDHNHREVCVEWIQNA